MLKAPCGVFDHCSHVPDRLSSSEKQLYRSTVKAADYDPYREMKSLPSQFAPWDLIPENKWSQWRETNAFLIPFELCNELHVWCLSL